MQSTPDEQPWEGHPLGEEQKGFPYKLDKFIGSTNYGALISTPHGNTIVKQLSLAAIDAEQLGRDSITDFLAVSFSTPDYIGHAFGPNSIEAEDGFLRLDKDLGDLLNYLDKNVGKNQYLVFLSADHGAAHAGGFSKNYKLPGGYIQHGVLERGVDSVLSKKYGSYKFLAASDNYQLYLDHQLIDSLKLNRSEMNKTVVDYLLGQPQIDNAFALEDVMKVSLPEHLRKQIVNGYSRLRSGDIFYLFSAGYMSGGTTGTTHGAWNPYDSHIPLLWYGWNVKQGKTNRETNMTDVSATLAAMLRIQMPNGCIGNVIEEIAK